MIYLGTSGWYSDHWIGTFYPERLDKDDWLRYCTSQFDSVEVNASFYRLPFENMVKGWRDKTPDDFVLSFKGSRVVTHRKKLRNARGYLERFYDRIALAGDRQGPILWQLPPWMSETPICSRNTASPAARSAPDLPPRDGDDSLVRLHPVAWQRGMAFIKVQPP